MAHKPAKVQTFHPRAVADSLKRQNEAVFGLLAVCDALLRFDKTRRGPTCLPKR